MAKRKYNHTRVCDWCGITFEGYPGKPKGEHHFCSKDCRCQWLGWHNQFQRVNQPGGLTVVERLKIRRSRLGTGEGKGYTKIFSVAAHRLIAEQKLGRPLRPGEVVHHIDENKRNNDPENLEVLPNQSVHAKLHLARGGGRFG